MDSMPSSDLDDSSDESSMHDNHNPGLPPEKCPICLGPLRAKAFTDTCRHEFCFVCLLTWTKVKSVCPLCKQNFGSIIHSIQSNDECEEYSVETRHVEELSEWIDIHSVITTARLRYRNMLIRVPSTVSRHSTAGPTRSPSRASVSDYQETTTQPPTDSVAFNSLISLTQCNSSEATVSDELSSQDARAASDPDSESDGPATEPEGTPKCP
ncbi:E3 ubiquitin-protein ligase Topors [Bicyclus anynana]|uniref:RING-type E3 ubiquitin transferase n=1 Tax=Bicyclus anynana TaxID=110368 RepID=A0A6J1N3F9_BICAN|nr:E3 ubiquitin-protein ligase Topors [Bicyclus anynana]XP_023941421.2 E3 ubiquitin-protein ligase Topors [Bicyclus anynana]